MTLDAWLLAAHLALPVLFALVLWDWSRLEPAWRMRILVALLLAAAGSAIFLAFVRADSIPIDWVTPLSRGRGLRILNELYGKGVHAGPNFRFILDLMTGGGPLHLRDVVRMNLWLAGLNGLFFLMAAWRILGRFWLAIPLAAIFALNRNSVHAALADTPAQLMTAYFLIGSLAASVFSRRVADSPVRAGVALTLLAVAAMLAAGTRVEMAVIGAAALAVSLARLTIFRSQPDFISRHLRGVLDWSLWQKVFLVATLAALSIERGAQGDKLDWALGGLSPLNPSFLLFPVVLQSFLPFGAFVLAMVGFCYAVRNLGAFLGLPIALLLLFRVYHSSVMWIYDDIRCVIVRSVAHLMLAALLLAVLAWKDILKLVAGRWPGRRARTIARAGLFVGLPAAVLLSSGAYYHACAESSYCEILRFTTHLAPFAMFLGLFGWRELSTIIAARWPGRYPQAIGFSLLVVLFIFPPGRAIHAFYQDGKADTSWLRRSHLQEEIRYLLRAMDRYPDAVLVTRLARRPSDPYVFGGWAFFGKTLPKVLLDTDDASSLEEILSRHAWLPRRTLYYHGLDCNFLDGRACPESAAGLRMLDERVFKNCHLCDPSEYGAYADTLRLAVYAADGPGRPVHGAQARCPDASADEWIGIALARQKLGDKESSSSAMRCAESKLEQVRRGSQQALD